MVQCLTWWTPKMIPQSIIFIMWLYNATKLFKPEAGDTDMNLIFQIIYKGVWSLLWSKYRLQNSYIKT